MELLLQSVPEVLLINSILLIILLIMVLASRSSKIEQTLKQDNAAQAEVIKQLINDNQRTLDDKVSRSQSQLFEMIMVDREKQLTSLEDLKLNLEKRFAATESALTNNVQSFKVDMVERFEQLKRNTGQSLQSGQEQLTATVGEFGEKIAEKMQSHQVATTQLISENIRKGIGDLRQDLDRSLKQQSEVTSKSIESLTESTDNRLKEISGQVEKRLTDGFEKTNQTFNDVIKRLALIDDAQKKITELSTNVVSLQEILNDKRSRGAFGEVQLQSLVSNIMPDSHYSMQSKLSNDKIADCVLILPEPTGKIAIDAKFPLESYKRMTDLEVAEVDRREAAKQFSRDIKKHISDIASKYVLPPETSDGAVMFIPAESVFAEIHGHYPELVEYAYKSKVWMVSPTTLMAILTTASTVIKDEQTRKQVHIIKEHLSALGKDFGRFQGRMDKLSLHIGQVSKDVDLVHTSAKKISTRFEKIERVDLSAEKQTDRIEKLTDS
jgi:DNA recombination protein RmuC